MQRQLKAYHASSDTKCILFYEFAQFAKAVKVTFDAAVCLAQAQDVTVWAPETTEILVWRSAFDIQYEIIPALEVQLAEQTAIQSQPNASIDVINASVAQSSKLQFGIQGWQNVLSRNQVQAFHLICHQQRGNTHC